MWMGLLVTWQGEREVWWCGLAGDGCDEGGVVVCAVGSSGGSRCGGCSSFVRARS